MRDSLWLRRTDRWLVPLAVVVALIGFFGPWIPHKAVALIVTGFELSEFAKFFPEVQARTVAVTRALFLTPLTAGALIIGLWANAYTRMLGIRMAVTAAAAFIALATLPQYESLAAPDYRGQLLLALGGCLLVLLTPLARQWPDRVRFVLIALIALAGILSPVLQYTRLHPLVVELYNKPVGVGRGLILFALGFGVAAAWAALRAAGANRRVAATKDDQPGQLRKELGMDENKGVVFYGTAWCPDCIMARRVLDQRGITYQLTDIDKDPAAAAYVKETNRGFRSVPTIVFPDGSILVEPSRSQLLEKLSAIS